MAFARLKRKKNDGEVQAEAKQSSCCQTPSESNKL